MVSGRTSIAMRRRKGDKAAAKLAPTLTIIPAARPMAPPEPSDDLDRAIVRHLQEDGRLAFAMIARALRVSEGTVRNRVARLKQSGVLRVIAVADPLALGYSAYAMIGIKLAPGADPDRVAGRFRDRPEVTYVLFVAGRFDLLVEAVCETQAALRDFLFDHCYRQPEIAATEPMIGLAMYKSLLKWGQP
jgi:Lrp/AsnC family transcriptional regulator for asnA, asnC and gidA